MLPVSKERLVKYFEVQGGAPDPDRKVKSWFAAAREGGGGQGRDT